MISLVWMACSSLPSYCDDQTLLSLFLSSKKSCSYFFASDLLFFYVYDVVLLHIITCVMIVCMKMLHFLGLLLVAFDRRASLSDGLRWNDINLSGHIGCGDKCSMLSSDHVQVGLGNVGTLFCGFQFTLNSANASDGLSRESFLEWRKREWERGKMKSIKRDLKFMIHSSIMQLESSLFSSERGSELYEINANLLVRIIDVCIAGVFR